MIFRCRIYRGVLICLLMGWGYLNVTFLSADEVVLTDGRAVNGTIVFEGKDTLTIEIAPGLRRSFSKRIVERIRREEGGGIEVGDAPTPATAEFVPIQVTGETFENIAERNLWQKAQVALEAGDASAAVVLLRRLLEQEPSHRPAREKLVDTLMGYDWNRYLDSLSVLSRARLTGLRKTAQGPAGSETEISLDHLLEESPEDAQARFKLAKLYMLQERYFYARSEIEHLLEREGENPGLILEYGTCLANTGREQEALAAYERCIALTPEAIAPYGRIAELYRSSGRYEECLERTREWQQSFPDRAFPFLERARTYLAMGDFEKAVSTLRNCLRRPRPYEDLVEIHYLWGLTCYEWSQGAETAEWALHRFEARKHFEKVLGLDPDYPGVARTLEELKAR